MSKKLFISAPLRSYREVATMAGALQAQGYQITYPWWEEAAQYYEGTLKESEFNPRETAASCKKGVEDCDVFVLVIDRDYPTKGAWVEFGIALALNKQILVAYNPPDAPISSDLVQSAIFLKLVPNLVIFPFKEANLAYFLSVLPKND